MTSKSIRTPNSLLLIAAGTALLLVGAAGAANALSNAHHYRIPILEMSGGAIRDAILGTALVFVAIRKSQFAGATAIIVATVLVFFLAMSAVASMVVAGSFHVTPWKAIYLAIAAGIFCSALLPWNQSANKPVFFCTALTFAGAMLLVGCAAVVARL